MKTLLDTRVLLEMRKDARSLSPAFVAWVESLDVKDVFLSVVSIQEIQVGIVRLLAKDPLAGTSYREWLERKVLQVFKNKILPVNLDVITATRLQKPEHLLDNATLIAATANVYGCIVATHSPKDFEILGAKALNPWKQD
jgi:predicted nucleic acid-binding protein